MSFIKEAAQMLGLKSLKEPFSYQIINFGGRAVYAEGFKNILSLTETEIVLGLKKGRIVISGSDLMIEELEENTVAVKGVITAVTEEA